MSSSIRVIPLGGIGEIGKNITVFEDDDQMVILDCGITFPKEEGLFGADIVLPDFSYIIEKRKKLRALVLTHAHEDHIGAVTHLMRATKIPKIYGTRFTLALLKAKCDEAGLLSQTEWCEILPEDGTFSIGSFEMEFLRVTHSIPDCVAVAFHTEHGTILHTGDLKLDPTPLDGLPTDLGRFAELGAEGVALYLADSTNADVRGHTQSERTVGGPLREVIGSAPGRVLVTCFSSHIHRIQQLIDAAHENGRVVCILGRSMNRNVNIARNLGYLDIGGVRLIKPQQILDHAPQDVVIICTGSQGEPLAVVNRVAEGIHPQITVVPTDTIVFSSRTIPGNEQRVNRMIDLMSRAGANIVSGENSAVHVSGHGSSEELQTMLQLVRPKHMMPVHGEWRHLRAHSELARAAGVPDKHVIISENGRVTTVKNGVAKLTGETVKFGVQLVDRTTDARLDERIVADRQRMSADGLLLVVVQLDENGESSSVSVTARAMSSADDALLDDALDAAEGALDQAQGHRTTQPELERMLTAAVEGAIHDRDRFTPLIVPVIVPA